MFKKASWLLKNLNNNNIKIVDASWYLPNIGRDAFKEYSHGHIKNAVFFDIDKVANRKTMLPHMLPTKKYFEKEVSKLGINNRDTVVIYCNEGILSSPRVWWTFSFFGHKNVYVLDGGLKSWKLAGGLLINKKSNIKQSNYKCKYKNKELVIKYSKLKNILSNINLKPIILYARPHLRFLEVVPEPRKNIGKGKIPGSLNFPFSLFDNNGFIKSKTEIRKILKKATNSNSIVCTCGSGVAACNIALSLKYIGNTKWKVYDGSWTEWYLNNRSSI